MKSNELRIGNYVDYKGKKDDVYFETSIYGVVGNTIYTENRFMDDEYDYFQDDIKTVKPIKLKINHIINLGFKETSLMDYYFKELSEIQIEVKNKKEFHLYFKDEFVRQINFVHELQNIYFALTKEELKINE